MKKYYFWVAVITLALFVVRTAALAADTPEQVYDKYVKALKAGKFDEMLTYVARKQLDEMNKFDKAKKEQMFKMMQSTAPKEYKVVKKNVGKDKAALNLEGKMNDLFTGKLEKATAVVSFVNEGGKWKILKEEWKSTESK